MKIIPNPAGYHIYKVAHCVISGSVPDLRNPRKSSMRYSVGWHWWSEETLGRVLNGMIYDPRHKSGIYVMCGTSKDPWKKQFRPGSWPIQLWGMWNQAGSSETWAHLHVFQHYTCAAFHSKVLVGAYMYCVYMYVCFKLFIDASFCRCSIVPQEINKHNVNFRACFVNKNFLLFMNIYIYINQGQYVTKCRLSALFVLLALCTVTHHSGATTVQWNHMLFGRGIRYAYSHV